MPPEPLRATVIVLGYNGLRFMDDCLSSALDQDFHEDAYEVIYADNASTDGSADHVRQNFPRVRVVQFDRNWGFAAGNNRAARGANGEWLVFLNQDTVCARSWLRELIKGVSSSPDIVAGHANIIHPWYADFSGLATRAESPNANTPDLRRWGYVRYRNLGALRQPVDVLILSGASLALRRSAVEELGYVFDEDFWMYAEDWDLGLRIHSLGRRCVLVPTATVYHLYTAKTGLRWANWLGTMRNLRNRYIAFYKVLHWREYIPVVALLIIGSPLNALEFGLKPHQKALYALALIPTTLVALIAAVLSMPRYASKRRELLQSQVSRPGWCLKSVWRGAVKPTN